MSDLVLDEIRRVAMLSRQEDLERQEWFRRLLPALETLDYYGQIKEVPSQ